MNMRRTLSLGSLGLMVFALAAVASRAEAATGDPVGNFEAASVSLVSGWTFDPDTTPDGQPGNTDPGNPGGPTPVVVLGCMDPNATNYDASATQDDGSCAYPPAAPCVARYRWINTVTAGQKDQAQECAAAGGVAVAYSSTGICASGEDRPNAGYDYQNINYSRGTWGGGNGGGGDTVVFQNGGYRCYLGGQNRDKDNTDVNVAYYCDFGASFPDSCPTVDAGAPTGGSGGGSGGKWIDGGNTELNFKGFVDLIFALFKPYKASAASSLSNSVELYDGAKESGGILLATVPANVPRSDVNAVMSVTGNHGFVWTPSNAVLDGNPHYIYAYGTDIEAPGQTTLLAGSPRLIQSVPGVTNTAPSNPTLTCPANGSFTNTSLTITFKSNDAEGDNVRYSIDWDGNGSTDELVPTLGFAAPNTVQSSSRSWTTPGSKTVSVTAVDTSGANSAAATCTFTLQDAPPGTDPVDNGSGNGDGTGGTGGTGGPGGGAQSGFTISADKDKAQIQFLGNLSGTSEPIRIEANSFGGFSAPITLRLVSVLSKSSGASLPQGTTVTASFDGQPFTSTPTTIQTYDGSIGRYRGAQGVIGSSFRVTVSKAVTESYVATIEGTSGLVTALFYLTLDPKATAPSFNEI